MSNNYTIVKTGKPLETASGLLVLLHGRGSSAEDILGLATEFPVSNWAIWAPEAPGGSWYPNPFMAPLASNEPRLSQSIEALSALVTDAEKGGIHKDRIVFGGFSQGASLAQEFIARSGGRWGGLLALSGGLIGEVLYKEHYPGSMNGTRVFIASSDPDPYIPPARVRESAALFESLGASVQSIIYPGMGHRVSKDEIEAAAQHVFAH